MRSEIHRRPSVDVPTLNAYAYPRIVLEYTRSLDFTLLSQVLGGNLGNTMDEFKSRYLTLVEFSKTHAMTGTQMDEVLRLFLRGDMLSFYLDLEPDTPILDKIHRLLVVFYNAPTIVDRLRQLKNFRRAPLESLESAVMRLSIVIDNTQALIPEA